MTGLETQATPAIITWISQWGQVVFFFAQLAYWLLIAAIAFFAAWQAKRFVDFHMGITKESKKQSEEPSIAVEDWGAEPGEDKDKADEVDIDAFVE